MNNKNPINDKSTYQLLWSTFSSGFKAFFRALKKFHFTSLAIIRFIPIKDAMYSNKDTYLSATKYSYRAFEYILIYLFILQLFSLSDDIGEGLEVFRDFFILLLFFIDLIIVTALGAMLHRLFLKDYIKIHIEAFFIYAFSLIFLPSYFIMHTGYGAFADDDDALGGLSVLFLLGFLIFLFIYFYRMFQLGQLSKVKSILVSLILSMSMSLFILVSLALAVGIAYPEM